MNFAADFVTGNGTSLDVMWKAFNASAGRAVAVVREAAVDGEGGPDRNTAAAAVPEHHLPEEMTFGSNNAMAVAVYSVLCAVASVGNLTVFVTLYCYQDKVRTVHSIADRSSSIRRHRLLAHSCRVTLLACPRRNTPRSIPGVDRGGSRNYVKKMGCFWMRVGFWKKSFFCSQKLREGVGASSPPPCKSATGVTCGLSCSCSSLCLTLIEDWKCKTGWLRDSSYIKLYNYCASFLRMTLWVISCHKERTTLGSFKQT